MSAGDTVNTFNWNNDESLAREIGYLFTNWNIARTVARQQWEETTRYVFATSTRETSNGHRGGQDDEGWSHSTHVPKITQIWDNLNANYLAALMPHDDFIEFQGWEQDALDSSIKTKVEAYIATKHRQMKFRTILARLLNDWTLYGNCFAEVYYVRDTHINETGGHVSYTGPMVRVISPKDIVFNPIATSFERSPKIVRSLTTLGSLLRRIQDEPEATYLQEGVRKMAEFRHAVNSLAVDDLDKYVQLQVDGFGSLNDYFKGGNVEILDFYGDIYDVETGQLLKNHVITVVDRRYVIRKCPIKTESGNPHIYHCGWRLRPDNLWAMGPLDNLVGLQYLINHLENARADAFDQMLFPTRVIVGDVDEDGVESGRPGGTYRIPSGEGSVQNLTPDTVVLQADIQIQNKVMQMEECVGLPREASGFRTPGEKTAFEVNQMLSMGSRIFQQKLNYYEEAFLERLFNAELQVARENLTYADKALTIDEETNAKIFVDITKEDLGSAGRLIATGARHYARKAQLAQHLMTLTQVIQQDPQVAVHYPGEAVAGAFNNLLDMDELGLMEKFGRIREMAEQTKFQASYEMQIQKEQAALMAASQEEMMGVEGVVDATMPQPPSE